MKVKHHIPKELRYSVLCYFSYLVKNRRLEFRVDQILGPLAGRRTHIDTREIIQQVTCGLATRA